MSACSVIRLIIDDFPDEDGPKTNSNFPVAYLKNEAGLINCVVVYKIDRLTRSLLDFSKIVEIFDKHNVSFVAVTQSFNTSNSMGRLMLNVLLSFAQYERELTGERIRDKVAVSKKKGYWMGGYAPLGYDAKNRSLVINKKESEVISLLFNIFFETRSVTKLLEYVKTNNIKTKSGQEFSKKTLRKILINPIYKGYIRHKTDLYKGLHQNIIDEALFDDIQNMLSKNSEDEKPYEDSNALLKKIIKCGICDCPMTPTHCNKHKRKYRYYTCSNHLRKKSCELLNRNIPAGEVEEYVNKSICKILEDPAIVSQTINNLQETGESLYNLREPLKDMKGLWETLHSNEKKKIVDGLITSVVVDNNG